MAVLENIRVKLGVFVTIIIAFSLLLFIVDADTLNFVQSRASSKHNVGEMNGKSIKDRDFQTKNESMKNVLQYMSNGQVDEDQVRDITWSSYVEDLVFKPAFEKAGVFVSQAEVVDLCQGQNISPVLQQSALFSDRKGNFDCEALSQFVSSIDDDASGVASAIWSYIESSIYTEQLFTKYASLLSQSDYSNALQTARAIEENNRTASVDFVFVPVSYAEDSTIVITDKEIKDHYNLHKESMIQKNTRDIDYVVFEVVPSEQDVIDTRAKAEEVYQEFLAAENPAKFLKRNSDRTDLTAGYYYKKDELASAGYQEFEDLAFGSGEEATPLFKKEDSFMAARITGTKVVPDSVYVEHIILQGENEAKADSIATAAAKDFLKVADEFTAVDGETPQQKVNLGWMTQSVISWFGQQYRIDGFDDIVDLPVGKTLTLKSAYGTHIFRVTQRTTPVKKVQIAVLSKDINASKKTRQDIYNQANDLLIQSGDTYEGFKSAAQAAGLAVMPAVRVPEGARNLGNYQNTIEIARWAFDARKGDVSHIITVDNKYYFVSALKAIHEEGYVPIADIQQDIRFTLTNEKRLAKQKEEVAAKIEGLKTIEEVAEALDTTVSHQDGVAFGSITRQMDPGFIGAVAAADQDGVLYGPATGQLGTYVFVVTEHQTGSFFSEDDARLRNRQIVSRQVSLLPQVLQTNADVKDYRGRFF